MKRQKRNKTDRAYNRGYTIGVYGKSRDMCPFFDKESRQAWLSGWRDGRADNWDGMTGTAGVARAPIV